MAVNIPRVQVNSPSAWVINQIQNNIVNAFNQLQAQLFNLTSDIGDIVWSTSTETQFQTTRGKGWVLMDGRNAQGSAWQTLTGANTIPDMRGTYPRMKDNGRGLDPHGDLSIGTFENDQFQGHEHLDNYNGNSTPNNGPGYNGTNGNRGGQYPFSIGYGSDGSNGTPRVGSETNPKTTILNAFLRIN